MPRDGSIGKEIFEQVEALIKQGKTKTEAFAQISSDSGRASGTVAANYYRVARSNGTIKPKRRARTASTPKATGARRARPSKSNGSIDQITAELSANIASLVSVVKAQDAEIKTLRGRLESARTVLK